MSILCYLTYATRYKLAEERKKQRKEQEEYEKEISEEKELHNLQ